MMKKKKNLFVICENYYLSLHSIDFIYKIVLSQNIRIIVNLKLVSHCQWEEKSKSTLSHKSAKR
jgi:hypothetical protein